MIDTTQRSTDTVMRRVDYLLGVELSSRLTDDQQLGWAGLMEIARLLPAMHDREMMARQGLSLTLLSLLGRLDGCDYPSLQARDLAVALGLSPGRVSRHLATLEHAGLLTRSRSLDDGRSVGVALTDAGRARLASARQTAMAIVERDFLSQITSDEMALLAQVAAKVLRAIEARHTQAPAAN